MKTTRCKTYTLAAATLRYADAAGSKRHYDGRTNAVSLTRCYLRFNNKNADIFRHL